MALGSDVPGHGVGREEGETEEGSEGVRFPHLPRAEAACGGGGDGGRLKMASMAMAAAQWAVGGGVRRLGWPWWWRSGAGALL